MKATSRFGDLVPIPNCTIEIAGETIPMYILPEISDSKSATYTDTAIMGRATPVKTYSQSENRTITMELHFIALRKEHILRNIQWLRLIQSAVYPRDDGGQAPYLPPPICKITCGELLSADGLCCVLKSYSVRFPPDQVWDETTLLPYKFDVSTTWDAVYASSDLPGQEMIAGDFNSQ